MNKRYIFPYVLLAFVISLPGLARCEIGGFKLPSKEQIQKVSDDATAEVKPVPGLCSEDFKQLCTKTTDSHACLEENIAKLSPKCRALIGSKATMREKKMKERLQEHRKKALKK